MKNFTLFHNHSHYSILDGKQTTEEIVNRAIELGMNTVGITDHGTLSGIIKFYKACKDKKIKPMIGCEMYLGQDKEKKIRENNHVVVIAKNYEGYKDLIKLNNYAAANFYYKPLLLKEKLFEIGKKGNIIVTNACIAGVLPSELFLDHKEAYNKKTVDECRAMLKENWLGHCSKIANEWKESLGDNFYLEAMIEGHPAQQVVLDCLREISKNTGIPLCASCDSHYSKPEDRMAHEILICDNTRQTLEEREAKRQSGEDMLFSDNSKYYIHSYEEMLENFTEEEINNTYLLSQKVEEFDIDLSSPKIPKLNIPNGFKDIDDFVYKKCFDRLKKLKKHKNKEYIDRLNFEFETFKNAKVSGTSLNAYFALFLDIVDFIKSKGSMPGVGRGSAAGCIISYLLGITRIDPIETDLSFQRFFNTGRLSGGHISLPDIDLDVSADIKDDVIKHLKEIWGDNKVLQISTFGLLKAKSSLKDVFRICGIDFDKANQISKMFPSKEIKHDEEAEETIQDAINISEDFKNALEPYKKEVELAKSIEGTIRNKSIHAAGVLISSDDVDDYLPLEWDTKSNGFCCSFDMKDAECFCVKIDILGLKLLSIFDIAQETIIKNKIKPCDYEAKKEYLYYPEDSKIEKTREDSKMEQFYNSVICDVDKETSEIMTKIEVIHVFNTSSMYNFLFKFKNNGVEIIKTKEFDFVKFIKSDGKIINCFCMECIDGLLKDEVKRNKFLMYVAYVKYYFEDDSDYFVFIHDRENNKIYKLNPIEIAKKEVINFSERVYADFVDGKIVLIKK